VDTYPYPHILPWLHIDLQRVKVRSIAFTIAFPEQMYHVASTGFSDVSRLSILEALSTGPLPVGIIVEKTGLSRTNVSNHLRCLADCDLVVAQSQGRFTLYQVSDPRVSGFLSLADELLRDVARGVYECTASTTSLCHRRMLSGSL
jgi:DNA-binding transcriptional ArsR family regulator